MMRSPHLVLAYMVIPVVSKLTLVLLFSRVMLAKLSHFWEVLLHQPDLTQVNLSSLSKTLQQSTKQAMSITNTQHLRTLTTMPSETT